MENPYESPHFEETNPEPRVPYSAKAALQFGWEIYRAHTGIATAIALVWFVAYVFTLTLC